VGSRTLLRRQVIVDALRKDQKTVLVFGKYTPRDIPDRMFNSSYLGQL
jgi:ribosomal protein L14E/L6E/L27E